MFGYISVNDSKEHCPQVWQIPVETSCTLAGDSRESWPTRGDSVKKLQPFFSHCTSYKWEYSIDAIIISSDMLGGVYGCYLVNRVGWFIHRGFMRGVNF